MPATRGWCSAFRLLAGRGRQDLQAANMAWAPVLLRPWSRTGDGDSQASGGTARGIAGVWPEPWGPVRAPAAVAPSATQRPGVVLGLRPFGPIVPKLEQQVCGRWKAGGGGGGGESWPEKEPALRMASVEASTWPCRAPRLRPRSGRGEARP